MTYPENLKQRAVQLSSGLSAGEVIKVLNREFKDADVPDERTIRRWCKNHTPLSSEQKPRMPGLHENWKEHNARLAGVAEILLSNDLIRVSKHTFATGEVEYQLFDEDEVNLQDSFTEDDLSALFEDNYPLAYKEYTEWFVNKCFAIHLEAEWPEEFTGKGFYIVADEQPYFLLETLRLLAERKTFKGTCPVCEDW